MPAKKHTKDIDREIRFLHRAIVSLALAFMVLGVAYLRIPRQIVTYIPPDVSRGFIQQADEVPLHAVYGFARTFWETLNYCKQDCGEEYLERLEKYRNYLSSKCLVELQDHFRENRGLYNYRSRLLLPTENAMFSTDNIRALSKDSWLVRLEYALKDDVRGAITRDNIVMYPLKVIKSGRPLDVNPMGLEVDCYFDNGPQTLKYNEIREEKTS